MIPPCDSRRNKLIVDECLRNLRSGEVANCLNAELANDFHFVTYSWVSRDVINFTGGQLPNRYTVISLKKIFTVCVDLVFGSKCVQFREICLLQCSTIINIFWIDPHSELLKKVPVKPKNLPLVQSQLCS